MKISIALVLLFSLIVAKEPVQVTLYASSEQSEEHDYVQISAVFRVQDSSLPRALEKAGKVLLLINTKVVTFCGGKDKKKCQESIDVSTPEIETKYQSIRKVETFMHFAVEYEITIKVYKTDLIGSLVDELQQIGITKFKSFEWKAAKEADEDASIIEAATERAEALCEPFGRKVDRVVSIEPFKPEEKEDKGDEEEEEEEEDEQEEDIIFKLVFECIEKKAGGAKAKSEEL